MLIESCFRYSEEKEMLIQGENWFSPGSYVLYSKQDDIFSTCTKKGLCKSEKKEYSNINITYHVLLLT